VARSVVHVRVQRTLTFEQACRMVDLPPTTNGRLALKRRIASRIRKSNGALAKFDPRAGYGPTTRYRITRVIMKKIFPEHFDDEVELGAEIRSRIDALRREIERLETQIERNSHVARQRDVLLARHIEDLRKRKVDKTDARL
jgi:uncharacterized small protein (DUF1192 family)